RPRRGPPPRRSDRLAAEAGDLVGVLIAPAGEADDQDRVGTEPGGFLQPLRDGVARLQRGEGPPVPRPRVVGLERLGIGHAHIADPAAVLPEAVLGADAGIVEAGGDRVHVLGLAVVVLEHIAEAAVEDARTTLRQAGGVLAGTRAPAPGLGAD